MTNVNPSLNLLAVSPASGATNKASGDAKWFEAMAEAWGRTLDAQAGRIENQSTSIGEGLDNPSAITQLTAESLKMSFLANSSHTSLSSVGTALEAMARKG